MNKTTLTVQDLISFYEKRQQEYIQQYKDAEKELAKGRLDEQDAYFESAGMEQDRLIIGLVGGFLENLRKLEGNQ